MFLRALLLLLLGFTPTLGAGSPHTTLALYYDRVSEKAFEVLDFYRLHPERIQVLDARASSDSLTHTSIALAFSTFTATREDWVRPILVTDSAEIDALQDTHFGGSPLGAAFASYRDRTSGEVKRVIVVDFREFPFDELNEAEWIGLLAHELAHSLQSLSANSQVMEVAADRFSGEVLRTLNLNPTALMAVLSRFDRYSPDRFQRYFGSHPHRRIRQEDLFQYMTLVFDTFEVGDSEMLRIDYSDLRRTNRREELRGEIEHKSPEELVQWLDRYENSINRLSIFEREDIFDAFATRADELNWTEDTLLDLNLLMKRFVSRMTSFWGQQEVDPTRLDADSLDHEEARVRQSVLRIFRLSVRFAIQHVGLSGFLDSPNDRVLQILKFVFSDELEADFGNLGDAASEIESVDSLRSLAELTSEELEIAEIRRAIDLIWFEVAAQSFQHRDAERWFSARIALDSELQYLVEKEDRDSLSDVWKYKFISPTVERILRDSNRTLSPARVLYIFEGLRTNPLLESFLTFDLRPDRRRALYAELFRWLVLGEETDPPTQFRDFWVRNGNANLSLGSLSFEARMHGGWPSTMQKAFRDEIEMTDFEVEQASSYARRNMVTSTRSGVDLRRYLESVDLFEELRALDRVVESVEYDWIPELYEGIPIWEFFPELPQNYFQVLRRQDFESDERIDRESLAESSYLRLERYLIWFKAVYRYSDFLEGLVSEGEQEEEDVSETVDLSYAAVPLPAYVVEPNILSHWESLPLLEIERKLQMLKAAWKAADNKIRQLQIDSNYEEFLSFLPDRGFQISSRGTAVEIHSRAFHDQRVNDLSPIERLRFWILLSNATGTTFYVDQILSNLISRLEQSDIGSVNDEDLLSLLSAEKEGSSGSRLAIAKLIHRLRPAFSFDELCLNLNSAERFGLLSSFLQSEAMDIRYSDLRRIRETTQSGEETTLAKARRVLTDYGLESFMGEIQNVIEPLDVLLLIDVLTNRKPIESSSLELIRKLRNRIRVLPWSDLELLSGIKARFTVLSEREKVGAIIALLKNSPEILRSSYARSYHGESHVFFGDEGSEVLNVLKRLLIEGLPNRGLETIYAIERLSQRETRTFFGDPEFLAGFLEQIPIIGPKIAQRLSTYGVFLPVSYREAFARFREDNRIENFSNLIAHIEVASKGTFWSEVESIERILGVGSMKVALLLRLKDGERVVLKAIPPERASSVRPYLDLVSEIGEALRGVSQLSEVYKQLIQSIVSIVRDDILTESDLGLERTRAERHGRHQRRSRSQRTRARTPRTHTGLNGPHIYTVEYVENQGSFNRGGVSDAQRERAALEVLSQLFNDGFVHGDLQNDANLLAARRGLVYFIDTSLSFELTDSEVTALRGLLSSRSPAAALKALEVFSRATPQELAQRAPRFFLRIASHNDGPLDFSKLIELAAEEGITLNERGMRVGEALAFVFRQASASTSPERSVADRIQLWVSKASCEEQFK